MTRDVIVYLESIFIFPYVYSETTAMKILVNNSRFIVFDLFIIENRVICITNAINRFICMIDNLMVFIEIDITDVTTEVICNIGRIGITVM